MLLKGKHILLGVTGGIAAFKAASLASTLTKQGAVVNVLMTENAEKFITPITFEGITRQKCLSDTFDRTFEGHIPHISLAQSADLAIIAPASANTIAKLSYGMADDMLTSTLLACQCKKLIAPAMNTRMYENPATQENLQRLKRFGWTVIDPACGYLACGDIGAGKMPEADFLAECIYQEIAEEKDMAGLRVLVTAGPTREPLDPVRYLTNHSSGKMGHQLAINAARRGAEVTLVTGASNLPDPPFVKTIRVDTAQEMFEAVTRGSAAQDILAFAAAVADYRPASVAEDKIKKTDSGDMTEIPLARTRDILKTVGEMKRPGQLVCGFSMETRDLLENSRKKLEKKNADLICANNVKVDGAGFGVDTNVITLIARDSVRELPMLSKYDTAGEIWSTLLEMRGQEGSH